MSWYLWQCIIYFLVYSFLGWILEVVFHAVEKGQIVNRGFLNGPLCPIYGTGVVFLLVLLHVLMDSDAGVETFNMGAVFVIGLILCTAVELFGGWALDRLFHTRWWDYRNQPFNLGGYICVKFSLAWGVACVFAVRLIHPLIRTFCLSLLNLRLTWLVLIALIIVFIVDVVITVMSIIGLNKRIKEIDELSRDMHIVSDRLTLRVAFSALETKEKLDDVHEQAEKHTEVRRKEAEEKLEALRKRIEEGWTVERRLFRAFPSLYSPDHTELFAALRENYENSVKERKKKKA